MIKKTVTISDIQENKDNPRQIDKKAFEKLKTSIKEFGEMLNVRPLVVNTKGVILGGNMRFKALKELGVNKVEVIEVDWDEEKQREFITK